MAVLLGAEFPTPPAPGEDAPLDEEDDDESSLAINDAVVTAES